MAYKIQLPEELSSIFPVFHVSQLRKCLKVPEQRIKPRGIKIKADLEYKEQPVGIVDTKERITRNRVVKTYKLVWSHHNDRDATSETEDYLKTVYPKFHKKWLVIASRSSSSSARAIAGKSSAARRRSHQSPNLDAKDTSALAFAAVSCRVRSTEVRSSRAPRIARRSCSDLARELRRDGSCYIPPLFARSLVR